MKIVKLRSTILFLGFLVLLTTLALTPTNVRAGNISGNHYPLFTISDADLNNLLTIYSLKDEAIVENVKVKIYNKKDELIYSTKICPNLDECDDRLNQFIIQSDFITEVDNTKIYILSK